MKCERCGHVKHEGSAFFFMMGFFFIFWAVDSFFKMKIAEKAFWVYLPVALLGGYLGFRHDRKRNKAEKKKEEKEVKFAPEERPSDLP